jgi:hypothetical protein
MKKKKKKKAGFGANRPPFVSENYPEARRNPLL